MSRYKQADFEDDVSSMGSVQLNEGISSTATHIRYHTGVTLWSSRSKLEKVLLVLVCILALSVFLLSTILTASTPNSSLRVLHIGSHNLENDVCLTPNCITSAAHMLLSLNTSADPCDDFYQYACGGWVAENPIPDGKSIWGTFGKLEQQNQLIVKRILEDPKSQFRSKAEMKAKSYYDACLDANETIEHLGPKPMQDLLKIIGGWNISGEFNVKTWNFERTLRQLHNTYNMGGLFSWFIGEDDKNSSRYVIQVGQGGLTLPTREHYLNKTSNSKVLAAYLQYMTKIGVLLGGEENSTRQQMQEVIDLETELAEITQPLEELRDEEKLYHLMPLSEVQFKANFMSWVEYFTDAMRPVNRKVTSKQEVVVYAPEYLEKLTQIVHKRLASEHGRIVLNNYLVWQTVRSLTSYLSQAFRDAYKGLRKALVGSEGGEEPWRYCVSDTNNVIGFALGAMFVRQVFQGDSKQMAEDMITEIRNAFKENLKNLQWMDEETRKAAIDKADAITDMIGFPAFILNPQLLDNRYKDLIIRDNEYFQNNIRVNQYNLKRNIERLDKPVNKSKWDMTPPTVNAYYTPNKNQIVFPAGILRSPFYDVKHAPSLNFGAMGVVMGHELTHAFDDQGREYDQHGNMHKWWNNRTIDRFKDRTECVVKQYSNYNFNGRSVNGKQTLGENIADNGGLKAAYHAYLNFTDCKKDHELPLPGLNLTHKQLFFLSFAQVWCSSSTVEATTLQIEKDTHSPPQFRVVGPLSNLPEFSEAFNCPSSSNMNPRDKCEVW